MKALITGAAGFAGRHLAAALREARWRVTTLDCRPPADLVLDLARSPLPRLSFDAVFHLAGRASPSASIDAPEETYGDNAETTRRLARSLRSGRLVLASSGQVYGHVPAPENPVDESRPPAPATPYAASKLCAESLALSAWKDVVVLRPFNHTGPGQSDEFVCPRIARQIARAEAGLASPVIEVLDLSPRLDLFDVRDMARAYVLAAERARPGEVYNVASGKAWSIRDIFEMLRAASRIPLRVRGPARDHSLRVGDSAKFRRDTGWKPLIPLRQTLRDLLEHERRAAKR